MLALTGWAHRAAQVFFGTLLGVGVTAGALLEVPGMLPPTNFGALVSTTPTVIRVRDLSAAAAWYEEKLGLTRVAALSVTSANARAGTAAFVLGNSGIELIEAGSPADIARIRSETDVERSQGTCRVRTIHVDDIDELTESLKEGGVSVIGEPRFTNQRHGLRVSLIRDLDGQVIELQHRL